MNFYFPQTHSHKKAAAVRKKKKKSRVDREGSPPDVPIDPDEPTYCVCEQVISCEESVTGLAAQIAPPKGKQVSPCKGYLLVGCPIMISILVWDICLSGWTFSAW